MNLQDIVRDRTRPVRDLLVGTEKEIEDYRRQQASEDARERALKQEASELRPGIVEKEETLRALQLKVQELERQIEELRERLRGRQEERQLAETALEEERQKLSEKTGEAKRARKAAEDWGQKLAAAQERTQKYRERLQNERCAALQKYLTELWTKLVDSQREAGGRKTAVAAYERLNRARDEDVRVADLWESRQEWQRIAESAGPAAVRQTAQCELERIEAELDNEFPGALQAAGSTLDELEEVYFYPWESGDGSVVLLPVPEKVCHLLNAGETGPDQDLAARVIWAFVRAVPPGAGHDGYSGSRFTVRRGFLALHVDDDQGDLIEHDAVVLLLPGGGRVSFMVSELPKDVSGAMSDENPDG